MVYFLAYNKNEMCHALIASRPNDKGIDSGSWPMAAPTIIYSSQPGFWPKFGFFFNSESGIGK